MFFVCYTAVMTLLEQYQHFSFDLDGTLVYTVKEYRYPTISRAVLELGGRVQSEHDLDRFWFESGRDRIVRQRFGVQPEKFWQRFQEIDNPQERARHTFVYEDTIATLKILRDAGKKISIITGNRESNARLEMAVLADAPYDYFLPLHENFPSKPHGASLHTVITDLQVTPEETVYVGNSNEDVYYAHNARVDFIYLERGEHLMNIRTPIRARIFSLQQLLQEAPQTG